MNLELQNLIPTRLPDIVRLIEREKTDPITAMVQSYAKIEEQMNLDIKMQESLDERYWHWECATLPQADYLKKALTNIKERYWTAYFSHNPEFKARYTHLMREFFTSSVAFSDADIMRCSFDRTNLTIVDKLLNDNYAEHATKMVDYFILHLNRYIDFSNTEPSDTDPNKQQIKSEIEAVYRTRDTVFRTTDIQYVESIINDFLVMARTGDMDLDNVNHSALDFNQKIVVENGDELLFTIQFFKKGYYKAKLSPEFKNAIDNALLL